MWVRGCLFPSFVWGEAQSDSENPWSILCKNIKTSPSQVPIAEGDFFFFLDGTIKSRHFCCKMTRVITYQKNCWLTFCQATHRFNLTNHFSSWPDTARGTGGNYFVNWLKRPVNVSRCNQIPAWNLNYDAVKIVPSCSHVKIRHKKRHKQIGKKWQWIVCKFLLNLKYKLQK